MMDNINQNKMCDKQTGTLWDALYRDEKNEVLSAYEESENDDNLIPIDEVFPKKS